MAGRGFRCASSLMRVVLSSRGRCCISSKSHGGQNGVLRWVRGSMGVFLTAGSRACGEVCPGILPCFTVVCVASKTRRSGTKRAGTMSKMEAKTSLLDNMIGVGDMVLLEPLTEESFINNLKNRFDHSEVYTYIGSVVISLNPYRPLPIYTADKVEEYRNRNFYELSPHM
ncbi:unconventional myosin-Ib isoform X1 [Arapaima gigas]